MPAARLISIHMGSENRWWKILRNEELFKIINILDIIQLFQKSIVFFCDSIFLYNYRSSQIENNPPEFGLKKMLSISDATESSPTWNFRKKSFPVGWDERILFLTYLQLFPYLVYCVLLFLQKQDLLSEHLLWFYYKLKILIKSR